MTNEITTGLPVTLNQPHPFGPDGTLLVTNAFSFCFGGWKTLIAVATTQDYGLSNAKFSA
jgi:hypothetical protein